MAFRALPVKLNALFVEIRIAAKMVPETLELI
jgi:hypothetical protein